MELTLQILAVSALLLLRADFFWRPSRTVPASSGGFRKQTPPPVQRLLRGPRHGLYLVREGNRKLLVGTSPAGCKVTEL
ncbi:MAG: hypothetical protein ABSF64_19360 [Bryobacteraceae bacterium]|jgi:hypothetical protein